jgi:hypothetical protein
MPFVGIRRGSKTGQKLEIIISIWVWKIQVKNGQCPFGIGV